MNFIDRPSPNHDARPGGAAIDMAVLHYTGMESAAAALARLGDPAARVSAHYLIDEDGALYRLVAEDRRAWHAGVSSWQRASDINSRSIGIELVNPGHEFGYRAFPEAQMAALLPLCQEIVARHAIPRARVLGHSDVAPSRKTDPGELFDWARLASAGLGLWPAADFRPSVNAPHLAPGASGGAVLELQIALDAIGYGIEGTGAYDPATEAVVAAFQRHFRQRLIDGVADGETASLIRHLAARTSA
jgi:N-acetylmuramoyl-L-alanine amidase